MAIKAYDKIVDAALSKTLERKLVSVKKIIDYDVIDSLLNNPSCSNGYSLELLSKIYPIEEVSAVESVYDNGLKFLDVQIKYRENEKEGTKNLRQMIFTTDYSEVPLVLLIIEINKTSIQEIMIGTCTKNGTISEEEKTILEKSISVDINNSCTSIFKSFIDTNTNSLLLEQYNQYYPVSKFECNNEDLLYLCGCGNRDLNILYSNKKAVYAQFSEKNEVEMAGLNPYSQEDIQKIINRINEEVSAITNEISSALGKLGKVPRRKV